MKQIARPRAERCRVQHAECNGVQPEMAPARPIGVSRVLGAAPEELPDEAHAAVQRVRTAH